MKSRLLFLSAVLIATTSFAAVTLPKQCTNVGFQFQHNGTVRLRLGNAPSWKIYAMTNVGKYDVWVTHARKERDADAGWDSILAPGNWSAILLAQHDFALACHYQKKSGEITDVPCEQVLVGCQYDRFTTPEPMHTGYWLVENVPFKKLTPGIRARGFRVEH